MNFYDIFNCSSAKVLDLVQIVGNMPLTIKMMRESTELSYKTIKTAVKRFVKLGLMVETAKVGNAQAYKFHISKLMSLRLLR